MIVCAVDCDSSLIPADWSASFFMQMLTSSSDVALRLCVNSVPAWNLLLASLIIQAFILVFAEALASTVVYCEMSLQPASKRMPAHRKIFFISFPLKVNPDAL